MLSELEQVCKTYSTESSSGLIEFDSNWRHIFVTALTFHLQQAIFVVFLERGNTCFVTECIWYISAPVKKGIWDNSGIISQISP